MDTAFSFCISCIKTTFSYICSLSRCRRPSTLRQRPRQGQSSGWHTYRSRSWCRMHPWSCRLTDRTHCFRHPVRRCFCLLCSRRSGLALSCSCRECDAFPANRKGTFHSSAGKRAIRKQRREGAFDRVRSSCQVKYFGLMFDRFVHCFASYVAWQRTCFAGCWFVWILFPYGHPRKDLHR